mmetsp:Transcript_23897/g.76867  ORF Transcript_23897/g.76867 Transcript_23897/m.76867 type:complete len:241 (+) Transcript_23897:1215-1937(+)
MLESRRLRRLRPPAGGLRGEKDLPSHRPDAPDVPLRELARCSRVPVQRTRRPLRRIDLRRPGRPRRRPHSTLGNGGTKCPRRRRRKPECLSFSGPRRGPRGGRPFRRDPLELDLLLAPARRGRQGEAEDARRGQAPPAALRRLPGSQVRRRPRQVPRPPTRPRPPFFFCGGGGGKPDGHAAPGAPPPSPGRRRRPHPPGPRRRHRAIQQQGKERSRCHFYGKGPPGAIQQGRKKGRRYPS